MNTPRAFTLIELLIVVAIIAILAAIAVPNFLEAQVRSKISRAYADMNSQATALESYRVDNGTYPFGYLTVRQCNIPNKPSSPYDRTGFGLSRVTTPVAYMTSLPTDPFCSSGCTFDRVSAYKGEPLLYWYDDYQQWESYCQSGEDFRAYVRFERIFGRGYTWSMSSAGPNNDQMMMWYALDGVLPAQANEHIVYPYDPTNGTTSEGFIARTNKGIYDEVIQTQ